MDGLFRGFLGDWDWGRPGLAGQCAGWWPALDVVEQDDKIVVHVEFPGVKSEDIEVSVQNGILTIAGEKKGETEEKSEGYYHSERRYGSFRRDIQLPSGIEENKVEATCRDGILTVTMPKAEQARARRIEVKK
jgi:HSP20 family protein